MVAQMKTNPVSLIEMEKCIWLSLPYILVCGDDVPLNCLTAFIQPASVSLHRGGSFLVTRVLFSAAHLTIIARCV